MRRLTVALILLGCTGAVLAQPAPPEAARCQACHDRPGDGTAPRLNGQRAGYILQRLREFHDPASQTAHATYFMWDVTTSLGVTKARDLAEYFAQLPPTARAPGARSAAGEKFYRGEGGCQACHGAGGEGGPGGIPRLAGQKNAYLRRQLESLSLMSRYHPQMASPSRNLSSGQIGDLVAYLGGG